MRKALAAPPQLDRSRRRRIEATIERLIALLDDFDGDPDLDDIGDYEPGDSGLGDSGGLWEQVGM